ncbi:MAG: putative sulfate exporter family transporter [Fimbriimonas sp.]|nr:putative sulfate exporter family transporter [Fimbriimonas sp.]
MSTSTPARKALPKILFWLVTCLCCTPLLKLPERLLAIVAPGALILGMALALTIGNPYPDESKKVSKVLLQAAVVLLGFSMDLQKVFEAGRSGLVFALISISGVFLLGWLVQRLLKVRPLTGLLVSTGTAICGGSAIAAMSTVTDAPQEDVSVAVGTVFLLNAVALVLFPPLGHLMKMTPDQFGTWSGIAIHDVSSVVGAATAFGGGAVQVATAVKLSRVLYLVPITLLVAFLRKRNEGAVKSGSAPMPWFIGLFVLASILSTYLPAVHSVGQISKLVAVAGFALSLFLIGGGITVKTLKAVGVRPLLQGVTLWAFISVAALLAVTRM